MNRKPDYERVKEWLLEEALRVGRGGRMPGVRELERRVGVSVGTAARALRELEEEGVVEARPRKGSFAVGEGLRRGGLEELREAGRRGLGPGFSAEELRREGFVFFAGSHDLALELLRMRACAKLHLPFEALFVGSLRGLFMLEEGRARISGAHLPDPETGAFNISYVKMLFPGREMALVNLGLREQGLMVRKGNPKGISGLADLGREDVIFAGRRRGCGTRIILDLELRKMGMKPSEIRGFEMELSTHLEVAAAVAGGAADAGMGIRAAALMFGLDFIPILWERYDLVLPAESLKERAFEALFEELCSLEMRRRIESLGGYRTEKTGEVIIIS